MARHDAGGLVGFADPTCPATLAGLRPPDRCAGRPLTWDLSVASLSDWLLRPMPTAGRPGNDLAPVDGNRHAFGARLGPSPRHSGCRDLMGALATTKPDFAGLSAL